MLDDAAIDGPLREKEGLNAPFPLLPPLDRSSEVVLPGPVACGIFCPRERPRDMLT